VLRGLNPASGLAPLAGLGEMVLLHHVGRYICGTVKANDVEPYAYHKDVLERMTHGHPMSGIDALLP